MSMKRNLGILAFTSAILLPTLSSCQGNTPKKNASSGPEPVLVEMTTDIPDEIFQTLSKAVPEECLGNVTDWKTYYGDFDSDGQKELLAFVYDNESEDFDSEGEYFFYICDKNGVNKLEDIHSGVFYSGPEVVSLGKNAIVSYEAGHGGPDGVTSIWNYENGKMEKLDLNIPLSLTPEGTFESNVSYLGAYHDNSVGNDIGMVISTYKYFVKEGKIREYGGLKMTRQQLLKFHGAKDLLDGIDNEGGTLGDIFYRSDGTIDVNYTVNDGGGYDNYYYTCTIKGKDIDWEEKMSGQKKAAFTPSVADYPQKVGK